jgi:hypothetical protein
MTDNPDNRAKLTVFAVLLGWLLVAAVVFGTSGETTRQLVRVAAWVGLPGLLIGMPLLLAWTNRRRIRDVLAEAGGQVESLRAFPLWRQGWGRHSLGAKFSVRYTDLLGRRHHAVCHSSFSHGVTWLEDCATLETGTAD